MSGGDYPEAREALAEAGRFLLEKGLVARTWGNLSVKVSDTHFLITPSGRNYESLNGEHMALVALDGLSWDGDMKPSSEKDLHARIYRTRPDVAAVIHTHQPAASSLAAVRSGFQPADKDMRDKIGPEVPCVSYALPTTKPLAKAVEATLKASGSDIRAMLLSNHGTVCTGADLASALNIAVDLEQAAADHVLALYREKSGSASLDRDSILSSYPKAVGAGGLGTSAADDITALLSSVKSAMPEFHFIVAEGEWVKAAAAGGKAVKPMLDDLAQLIGPDLPVVDPAAKNAEARILKVLKRRSAVLLRGVGCLCAAKNPQDAEAVAMVAEKGSRAVVESTAVGGGYKISLPEAMLMRMIYLMKYSKKAG